MSKNYLSNEQMLQVYGALFLNLSKENEISTELSEYGYNEDKINVGKKLFEKARQEYDKNKKETAEENTSYALFKKKFDEVTKIYSTDRKKAKIIFKEEEDKLKKLSLKGTSSKNIANLVVKMRLLYQNLDTDESLLNAVKILKVTPENVKKQLTEITEAERLYANYLQEKGESQQATKDKDKAFADLEKWVKELYTIAKIALEDKPQLLESLGKLVRS